jgi:hypothetical protein
LRLRAGDWWGSDGAFQRERYASRFQVPLRHRPKPQVPPLRFAPVPRQAGAGGMTKFRVTATLQICYVGCKEKERVSRSTRSSALLIAISPGLFAQSASAIHLREQDRAYEHDGGDAK